MSAPRSAGSQADFPEPVHAVARELLGVLPFGARADALARCPRLAAHLDDDGDGEHTAAAVVEAIESFTDEPSTAGSPGGRPPGERSAGAVHLPDRYPEPLPPTLVRRMLHVLLATRDLGWPGTDAPLSVRRVAAADLFFDATQAVLSDDDWKGPNGVEFALLTALAGRVCEAASLRASLEVGEGRARAATGERLGHLHRVQRPRHL